MLQIVIELIGFSLLISALRIFQKSRIHPIAELKFENLVFDLNIQELGYYSVSIIGAGSVKSLNNDSLNVTFNMTQLNTTVNRIPYRFTKKGKIGLECWGFTVEAIGLYTLSLNLKNVIAKESMLIFSRLLESPINHSKLRIMVHKSVRPIYKFMGIISLILGVNLVLIGLLFF